MFMRFVIPQIHEDSRRPKGVFAAAHELLESGDLGTDELKDVREVLAWFNQNLPHPPEFFAVSKAIFWFKSDATESINRIWSLVNLLRLHGYFVEVQKYRELGNIVYEDDLQVAAIPSRRDRK